MVAMIRWRMLVGFMVCVACLWSPLAAKRGQSSEAAVGKAMRQLKSRSVDDRRQAAEKLGPFGDDGLIVVLRHAFSLPLSSRG